MTSRAAGGLARLQGALPLLVLYFGLAAFYAWQASRRPVPTIFTDELELTQLSRAIAETGEPARRGEAYGIATLVAYLLAPVWWLGTTTAAYATAKVILVLSMTATVFPAYGLARLVVPPWYALAAAGAATTVPALAYSPIFVEEPLAYPLSTLALFLIARTLVAPSWGRVAAALAASAVAALTRTQLAVLFAVLGLGLLVLLWWSEPLRRWRAGWTTRDWVGAVTLGIGAVLASSALMGHASASWRETTGFYKERVLDHSAWAMGALAIGIGIVPLVVGVAALARPAVELRDPKTRAFVTTSAAALLVFLWYAGIKGAYISTVFSTLVVERNLIYLCPVLLAATALAFHRGVHRVWAIALGSLYAVYVVVAAPLRLDNYPYYEAHGLAMPAFLNRELGWSEDAIETVLLVACALAVAVAVALWLLRRSSTAFRAVAAVAAVGVVAWSLTAEVYAAEGERILSAQIDRHLPKPYDWVERVTGGDSVVVIGQRISDPTGVWLLEFFNPSIRKMWSLDGTAPNPGPILTPDLEASDGTLTPTPETEYALALNGVELQARPVAHRGNDVLYDLDGGPLKLRAAVTGLESDGWLIGSAEEQIAKAAYTRYDVSRDPPGFVLVALSRLGWCPKPPGETTVTLRIGPVAIGPDKQPALASVVDVRQAVLADCTTTKIPLATLDVPWRVEVTVAPTVSPRDVDPTSSERRQLGATMTVQLVPLDTG